MKKLIITTTLLLTLFSTSFAGRPDSAGWTTVNKTLQNLIYEDSGEIISTEFSGSNVTTIYIRANNTLYKWIEKTNGMNSKVSATECKQLLNPSAAQ